MKTRTIGLMDGRTMSYGAEGSDEFNAGFELRQIQEQEERKHNGWASYATWRVALEAFDGFDPTDYWDDYDTLETYDLAERLKDNVEELLFYQVSNDTDYSSRLLEGYARAFLADVNWYEIAENIKGAFPQEAN